MWIPGASLDAPALFIAGAASGVHCGLMCGAIGIHQARGATAVPMAEALAWLHGGRILGYALLGAVAGALGQSILLHLPGVRSGLVLQALAAVGLVVIGARLLWQRESRPVCCGPQPGSAPQWLPRRLWLLGRGLLWALLPCGLLYSVLLLAALSGGGISGALLTGAFAAGGTPLLAGIGWSGRRGHLPARVAGWWMIALGLAGFAAALLLHTALAAWCAAPRSA